MLENEKQVDGRGIELSQSGVNFCVAKGLSVIQGDADHDLVNYPDQAFDYAILSQTLQATMRPKDVLEESSHWPPGHRLISQFRALENTAANASYMARCR